MAPPLPLTTICSKVRISQCIHDRGSPRTQVLVLNRTVTNSDATNIHLITLVIFSCPGGGGGRERISKFPLDSKKKKTLPQGVGTAIFKLSFAGNFKF